MLVSAAVQLLGVLAVVVGLVWLFGPWALVASGFVLLVVPELVEGVGRRGRDGVEVRG